MLDDALLPPVLDPVVREVVVDDVSLLVLDEAHQQLLYGGNKVRKLRGLLIDALRRGAQDLVTFGAIGSHHVLATALWGRRVGLRTHALWIPQPHTVHVEAVARAAAEACASVTAVVHLAELPMRTAGVMAGVVARTGRAPYRIPPGGSSVEGTRGWVELAQRLEGVGDLDEIVVASGSGGTAAGLLASGVAVRAVRVGPRSLTNRSRLRHLARRAGAERLGGLEIDHGYIAGGYGQVDARTRGAWQAGILAGLHVETTYSAKALACALDRCRQGARVLYVQSASGAPEPEAGLLDASLAHLFRER